MFRFFSFFVFSSLLFFHSCKESTNESVLYTSGGKTSEILVVISDELWKSQVGDTITSVLGEVKPWLAQEEPWFDLFVIKHEAFADVYQKYRNVLIVKINSTVEENLVKARKDVFAKPQTIIDIKAKSKEDFYKMFDERKVQIGQLFHENELERIASAYRGLEVDSITTIQQNKFGFSMIMPQGFFIAANKADFAWIRKVTPDIEEGFLIYTKPYSKTDDFNLNTILAYRDSITKIYIPGPLDSTYMKTSEVFPHHFEITTFKGNYAALTRSWWDIYRYPMGGPFINYTFVDTLASRLITIDGYIKAPKKTKRDLLLHLEAIMSTFTMEQEGKN